MRVTLNLSNMWPDVLQKRPQRQQLNGAGDDLQTQVGVAHREWQAAQQYFQMVSEPALVDHAIFTVTAAQKRYMYLYRQLRQQHGLPVDQEV